MFIGNANAIGARRRGVSWASYWAQQTKDFNVVIEGHSFAANSTSLEDYLLEKINEKGFYNSAVGASLVSGCEDRAAVVDSKIINESDGVRNILILWIGVNSFVNDIGIGATRYAEVKSYVEDRVAAGWKIFVYTMTPSTSGGRNAVFESERGIFNELLRSDLGTNQGVFILDTDTLSELDDPSDTTYYLDTIHLTQYGYYLAAGLFEDKIISECPNYTIPSMVASPAATLTVTPEGAKTSAIRVAWRGVDEPFTATLDGVGKFYIDAACTQGERSLIKKAPDGFLTTFYIKASTACNLRISSNKISYLDWYDAGNNGASPSGSITNLNNITDVICQTNNALSGDLSFWTKAVYMNVRGANTLSGSVTNNTSCIHLENTSAYNVLTGSIVNMPDLVHLDVRGNNQIKINSGGRTWSDSVTWIRSWPAATFGLALSEVINLIVDISGAAWAGSSRGLDISHNNASMADTNQGGIWGNFDGETSPSDLAIAYKSLIKTKSVTVVLTGIAVPGATGDGTGFPAGFGDWYRS